MDLKRTPRMHAPRLNWAQPLAGEGREDHPGGRAAGPLRSGHHTLTEDLAGCCLSPAREPAPMPEQSKTGRGWTQADRQQVWSPPGIGQKFPAVNRPGHIAVCRRAQVERQSMNEGRVPGGHKPHGKSNARSTPLGIVAAESGLAPARALLDHRQARFTQRLLARPMGGNPGPEEIMGRRGAALADRLRAATFLQEGERAEEQR